MICNEYHAQCKGYHSQCLLFVVIIQAAIECAVEPYVASCVARLAAMETDTANQISQMRRRVKEIVSSLSSYNNNHIQLQKMANKLLHAPTMQLREGVLSEEQIDDVVNRIEKQLTDESCRIKI